MVTTAVVLISSGLCSTLVSCPLSAIVKQPACAAAINSSGFVPTPFSKRVLKLYCASLRTPLCVLMVPLPSFNPPRHTADALRSIMSLLCEVQMRGSRLQVPGCKFYVLVQRFTIENRRFQDLASA